MRKITLLHELGGIGETPLANRFARVHKDGFCAIFWLNGKDRTALVQSLMYVLLKLPGSQHMNEVSNEEEVEQRARQVLKWLATHGNSRWLLIFDNIDHMGEGYDINEFFHHQTIT